MSPYSAILFPRCKKTSDGIIAAIIWYISTMYSWCQINWHDGSGTHKENQGFYLDVITKYINKPRNVTKHFKTDITLNTISK